MRSEREGRRGNKIERKNDLVNDVGDTGEFTEWVSQIKNLFQSFVIKIRCVV